MTEILIKEILPGCLFRDLETDKIHKVISNLSNGEFYTVMVSSVDGKKNKWRIKDKNVDYIEKTEKIESFVRCDGWENFIGKVVQMKTKTGSLRKGIITEIRWNTIDYYDYEKRTIRFPHFFIINNDPADRIMFMDLLSIKLIDSKE